MRVMWLRVCCVRCSMAVVWCCDGDDCVAVLSVAVCVVWAMCCVRADDDDDDDATMVDVSP